MGGATTLSSLGIIISALFASACCLCGVGRWLDTESANCRPCTVCRPNYLVVTPCTNYSDAVCLSFSKLEFNLQLEEIAMQTIRPTHETEFQGVPNWAPIYGNKDSVVQNGTEETTGHMIFALAIGCILAIVFLIVVLAILSYRLSRMRETSPRRGESRYLSTRARLFSRDRLNTTEYKYTLAGLDRKLAMDEILEKKRASLATPGIIRNNPYVDDVFMDMTTVPLTTMEGTRR